MPVVEFTESFKLHRGPSFNKGERAMLSEEEARAAQQQRCAVLVQDANGYAYDGRKSLDAPFAHKQIKSPPASK